MKSGKMEIFKVLKIIFWIFALLSGYFLYDILSYSSRSEKFKNRMRLRAKILQKEIIQQRGVIHKIIYEYDINNQKYQGDNWVNPQLFNEMKVGHVVQILVDKNDFEESRLEDDKNIIDKRKIISLTLLIIFGFIAVSFFVTLIIYKN